MTSAHLFQSPPQSISCAYDLIHCPFAGIEAPAPSAQGDESRTGASNLTSYLAARMLLFNDNYDHKCSVLPTYKMPQAAEIETPDFNTFLAFTVVLQCHLSASKPPLASALVFPYNKC